MNHTRRGPKIVPRTPQTAQNAIPDETHRMESCATCGRRWTGLAPAHCQKCHETFTDLTAFERHRTGSHAQNTRRCLHPAQVGLIRLQRTHFTVWTNPGEERPPR